MKLFTEQARIILQLTQEAAERLGSASIDSEHLLLGIATEPKGIGGRALRTVGVNTATIEAALGYNPLERPHPLEAVTLSRDVRRALEYSVNEAHKMRSQTINTEHLLLGILRLNSCRAIQVLQQLNVSPEQVQNQVRALLKTPRPSELRRPYYDQPPPRPAQSQVLHQAADASVKHMELMYDRISRRKQWPNLSVTVAIAFVGTLITAIWSEQALELVMRLPTLIGLRLAVDAASWLIAVLIPPLAAALAAHIVIRDMEQQTLPLLMLTNLDTKSLIWGYMRGILYRLRLLLAAALIIVPILQVSLQEIPLSLYQLAPTIPLFLQVSPIAVWFFTPTFFVGTLLGVTWLGIALGIVLPFKLKEVFAASAVASLITFISLLTALLMGSFGLSRLITNQFTSNHPPNVDNLGSMSLVPGIVAFILGLLILRFGQNWMVPAGDAPILKHPLSRRANVDNAEEIRQ